LFFYSTYKQIQQIKYTVTRLINALETYVAVEKQETNTMYRIAIINAINRPPSLNSNVTVKKHYQFCKLMCPYFVLHIQFNYNSIILNKDILK